LTYQFILPIMIVETKKTKKNCNRWLNLNNYRNWHHQVSASLKKAFTPIQIPHGWPGKAKQIKVEYFIHRAGNVSYDTMNVVSVVDKFFLDWMITNGLLVDDSFNNVSYGKIVGYNGSEKSDAVVYVEVIK